LILFSDIFLNVDDNEICHRNFAKEFEKFVTLWK
jgi:hypothetical protein